MSYWQRKRRPFVKEAWITEGEYSGLAKWEKECCYCHRKLAPQDPAILRRGEYGQPAQWWCSNECRAMQALTEMGDK